MPLKFIHAADLHIDSPLDGLSAHEGAPVEVLRTATRSAFSNLIDRAIEEEVAFVCLPGDIYDGNWNDYNTGYYFGMEMARLKSHGIRAFIKRGNHDAENEMTRRLPLPDNVFVFNSDRAETFTLEHGDLRVALHGQSFKKAATIENLVPGYPNPLPGYLNLGVLHTALEGNAAHATYAPCSLDELRHKGYDGWLLGHVHQWIVLCEDPVVAYSGNLQGRHAKETGARGALLYTVEDGTLRAPERLLVDVVRWAVAHVDITGCASRAEVVERARGEFERILREEADGRPVACRIVFTGRSPAHAELFGHGRLLRAELTAEAINAGSNSFWNEKIRVESQPALDAATIAARGDAVAEMQALLAQAAQDPAFLGALKQEFGTLLGKVERDLFDEEAPALTAAKSGDLAPLIASVTPAILERVAREG
jgi:DNA repair exonuclease SbcCD nuclease subunit